MVLRGQKLSESPLVSIIVPVYNVEKYVEECIISLINQTYSNIEIILVNDGSTDSSIVICNRMASEDARIKVFSKENGGLSSARNYGLKEACGEYVTFVDSDDYVSVSFVENTLRAAFDFNADLVQANETRVAEDYSFNPSGIEYVSSHCRAIDKTDALNKRAIKAIACAKLYLRAILGDDPFPVGYIHEDDATYYKFVYAARGVVRLDSALYFYRMSSGSITRNTTHKKSTIFMKIYAQRIEFFKQKDEQVLLNGSYARYGISLILFYANRKKDKQNENDLSEIVDVYKQNYKHIRFDKTLKFVDKALLRAFRYFPRITALLIGLIK